MSTPACTTTVTVRGESKLPTECFVGTIKMASPEPESATTRTVADGAHDETQRQQDSWSDRFTSKKGTVQREWGYY